MPMFLIRKLLPGIDLHLPDYFVYNTFIADVLTSSRPLFLTTETFVLYEATLDFLAFL